MPDHAERLSHAQAALATMQDRPADAANDARRLIEECDSDEAAVVALRALAMSQRYLGDLRKATTLLRRSIRLANRLGVAYRAAEARMSLVLVLGERGQTEAALQEAERAAPILRGVEAALLRGQLGVILQKTGRFDEALACYEQALSVLRRHGEPRREGRVLNWRGVLYAQVGNLKAAEADFRQAMDLARVENEGLSLNYATANLGFVTLRSGDIPRALALFDEAYERAVSASEGLANYLADKAEALLLAGLGHEAREAFAEVIAQHDVSGVEYDLAEAYVMYARAALLDDDPAAALEAAKTARSLSVRQRWPHWAAYARHVEITARHAQGENDTSLLRDAIRNADELEATGWSVLPERSRFVAARVALALRRQAQAESLLAALARNRSRGPAELRVVGWHAEALRLLANGDVPGAGRALRGGLRVLRQNSATLGATDLRAHSAVYGEELATLGTRLALEHGTARSVLSWSEEWRAAALRQRPVRPPHDEELAGMLAELRRVVTEAEQASAQPKAVHSRGLAELQQERLRLEAAVRDRSRHAPGSYAPEPHFHVNDLVRTLGERALIEYVRIGDRLYAVTVANRRCRLHELGAYSEALTEMESLRFVLHRQAREFGSPAVRAAGLATLAYSTERLDQQLLAPLRDTIGDRELVIVPTGTLHALPWPTLPSCVGRPVSVSPSARTWLATMAAATPGDTEPRTVLVAGPGLAHAEPETQALALRYPSATHLKGSSASAQAVSTAIDGADLAHIAAHGHFRADNPQFSCLDLADGPLTVYDLERLGQAPRLLVLSACDSALSGIRPGNELMGMASALFALGTRTLIAAVNPVNDQASHALMLELHDQLAAGGSPAAALAAANRTVSNAAGFVCFGAG